jgi:hypothetical protein
VSRCNRAITRPSSMSKCDESEFFLTVIMEPWRPHPCLLPPSDPDTRLRRGRLGAAYYITGSRGEPRLQAASPSLLLRQLEPSQSQTAIMGYDFRRLGQFDAPGALCRLALAVSSIG